MVLGTNKARKRLTHKLFPSAAVRPQGVPGTNWACPRDKLGFDCVKRGESPSFAHGTCCF